MTEETKKDKIIEKEVTMLANLKWSDTDNFYMNLGCHKVNFLLAIIYFLMKSWSRE